MNIKITYNWLLDYLDTDADPYEIQKYLSLCGPAVEKVDKIGDDYVMDIEITSNRIDNASVIGIAQECQAILPQFGKKATIKSNPITNLKFTGPTVQEIPNKLKVTITDPSLCSHFCAVILSDLKIEKSVDLIKERLEMVDIKSINNLIDISNYLMITLGQPAHVFDFDKIGKGKMVMRLSQKGEQISTLDKKTHTLPGGDIIMEDGDGKLIDLCGIMGGLSSCVDENTKNTLLFLQNYDKKRIRQTTMLLSHRTMAASYFEKGLDNERVEAAAILGIEMIKKYCHAGQVSEILDIYAAPYKTKEIQVSAEYICKKIGVEIESKKIIEILEGLGFGVTTNGTELTIKIPSFRAQDVDIKEDIVEEVARIYGYNNLPSNLQKTLIEDDLELSNKKYFWENKIKFFLKHLGLNEVYNYSMISKSDIENLDLNIDSHLKIENTISTDIEYMRTSLTPSLVKNVRDNQGKKEILSLFEIANVYTKKENDLPDETRMLGIVTNTSWYEMTSILSALFNEFNIKDFKFEIADNNLFEKNNSINILIKSDIVGTSGKLALKYQVKNNLKNNIFLLNIDFAKLLNAISPVPKLKQLNQFAVIKYDLTIEDKGELYYQELLSKITSPLLQKVEVLSLYQGKINLRFYFSSLEKNLTEVEVKEEIAKIQKLAV